ncbi:MAG: rhodanese-like domain-containing protein [Coprococcus sp.]
MVFGLFVTAIFASYHITEEDFYGMKEVESGFTSIPIRNIIHEAVARGGIIVDVRSREEFASGHIPMAINVPLEQIEEGAYSLPRVST